MKYLYLVCLLFICNHVYGYVALAKNPYFLFLSSLYGLLGSIVRSNGSLERREALCVYPSTKIEAAKLFF